MTRPLTPEPSADAETGTVVVVVVEAEIVDLVVGSVVGAMLIGGADDVAIVVDGDPTAASGVGLDESQAARDTDAMTTKSVIAKRLSTYGWTNRPVELVPCVQARLWRVIAGRRVDRSP